MNRHQIQLINDNPNLSVTTIARLIGVNRVEVCRYREKPKWTHKGNGVPFLTTGVSGGGINYKVRCKNRTLVSCSSLNSAITNVDRLIYCLENNNGKLPRTLKQVVFEKLEFLK